MPNRSPVPRHMLGIGYNAAADPVGEAATRESNNGRRDMVFSETLRPDFEAAWARSVYATIAATQRITAATTCLSWVVSRL